MNRQRERNVFIISSLIYTIAIFIFGMTHSVWVMIGSIALFTFAELMTAGIGQTFISKLAPETMRGQIFRSCQFTFHDRKNNCSARYYCFALVRLPMDLYYFGNIGFSKCNCLRNDVSNF